MLTVRRGGTERHLVVEGPPGTSAGDVLSAMGDGQGAAATVPARDLTVPVRHGGDLGRPGLTATWSAGPPWIVVAEGPDAGGVAPLPPGRWVTVGRDPGCDLSIDDPALSRLHARVRLDRHGVRVEDLGSTNGIAWETGEEPVTWPSDDRLRLGSSALVLLSRPPAPAYVRATGGYDEVVPWPRRPQEVTEVRLERPPVPERRRVRPPNAWTWGLPLAVAGIVALVLRMPWLLMFGLLGPAMVLGHHLAERRAAREEHAEACAAHAAGRQKVEEAARAARREELARRRARDPGVAGVSGALLCSHPVSSAVWSCGNEAVRLVVGAGTVLSEVSIGTDVLGHRSAPVVVTLDAPLVVVGPRGAREGLMRSLLLQIATRHPPDQVTIVLEHRPGASSGGALQDLLAWLPHTSVGAAPRPRGRVLTWGQDLLLLEDAASVPPGSILITVLSATRAVLHRPGEHGQECAPTLLGAAAARRMARRLAPLRLPEPRGEGPSGPGPRSPSYGDLVGWPADAPDVLAGWDRPGTDVVLGVDGAGAPVRIDLVSDGPHALVAGTTGSGKSELLRTLVTGLALRCSPAELALLLVDYKGGSSLGECAQLPHVTGLVTDLDPHLAERVLVSLQAELSRRESVLQSAGARDLREYSGDDLPRLVVVVDEFRVLAEEVPEVLARLVRLAVVGRSLGVHLVLATQRPAGVVSADLRANVNLRIALRVRDVADSHDVLDCGDAAALPEGRPGLALVRTGPDAPRQLQVARVTRPGTPSQDAGAVCVREHADVWSARADLDFVDADAGDDEGAVVQLTALTGQAAQRRGLRPPIVWLPPLPGSVEHTAAPRTAWAVLDRPEAQCREHVTWAPTRHLGIVGSARSGRSTALRSVLTRLEGCWIVVLDLGQGLGDEALRGSGACCAWVGPEETAHGLRVLDLLQDLVRRRQIRQDDPRDPVVVVLDGWDRLVDQYGEVERGRGVEMALRLMREGPAVDVVALVSGDRSLLAGKVAALLPETWALPLNDPSDLLLTGLRSAQVPRDRPPGRMVGVRDGVVGQVVLPDPGGEPQPPVGHEPPLSCVALPLRVDPEEAGAGGRGWAVGGDQAEPLPAPDGHLLVLGPPGSGRSWTLGLLASLRPGPSLRIEGAEPPTVDELRDRLGDPPRPRTVIVDDAHLLAGTIVEELLLEHVGSSGADLLLGADLDSAAGSFRGLVPAAARARSAVVLQPEVPGQGSVVGVQLPVGDVRVPGRGVLVHRGRCTRLQVVSPPACP